MENENLKILDRDASFKDRSRYEEIQFPFLEIVDDILFVGPLTVYVRAILHGQRNLLKERLTKNDRRSEDKTRLTLLLILTELLDDLKRLKERNRKAYLWYWDWFLMETSHELKDFMIILMELFEDGFAWGCAHDSFP